MKKVLVLAAALLVAAPAAAQESPGSGSAVVEQGMVAQAQQATEATTPSIFVSRAEIQQRVATMEAEREGAQVGSGNFLYMVAAIALGVLIALLLID